MNIIAVDDEPKALSGLLRVLKEVEPEAVVAAFTDSEEAFAHLAENKTDVAFLDIKMSGLNGIELAQKCKSLCPTVNIIFVTGYSQYVMEAFQLRASGYLMKPVRAEDLRAELQNLRHPIARRDKERVRIQTFGNFEIFVDGTPLCIPLAKSLECLAYLVDRRGALVTMAELADILWEGMPFDRSLQNRLHQVIFVLMKALKERGVEDIILKQSRKIAVVAEKVDCDYYRALSGDMGQFNLFLGEYMNNYSWAEFTVGGLVSRAPGIEARKCGE